MHIPLVLPGCGAPGAPLVPRCPSPPSPLCSPTLTLPPPPLPQTLINLSMSPALMPTLQLYKVPDYVHGANVPATHFERPAGTSSGAAPAKLEHQDSLVGPRGTGQRARMCRCAKVS